MGGRLRHDKTGEVASRTDMSGTDTELSSDTLLDWNESPIGPPLSAVRRVAEMAGCLHRYPRGLLPQVTKEVAEYFDVGADEVLLTAGVDEATDIALSLADRAWVVRPCFDGYLDRARANRMPHHHIDLGPDWQPQQRIALGEGDMVFLAQPNNPTGNYFRDDWVREVRGTARYVFLDETYQEFSSRASALRGGREAGLLVYRSFSKAMGLAGIRLGCLIARPEVIARLAPMRRFMPVDSISLHAASAVLADVEFRTRMVDHVRRARARLTSMLRQCPVIDEVCESEANFVLARPSQTHCATLLDELAVARVRVRDCTVMGLPGWLRVTVGSWEDQDRLGTVLKTFTALRRRGEHYRRKADDDQAGHRTTPGREHAADQELRSGTSHPPRVRSRCVRCDRDFGWSTGA